jgi:hypothetical protein
MITLLGFGSSARRGHRPWTDRVRVRGVIDVLEPDIVVDGASPSGGADDIIHEEAVRHFRSRPSNDPDEFDASACRCPMDERIDGHRGFLRRNARMYRTHRPTVAAGFIVGAVGTPMSSGSANMAGICMHGLDGVPPCPLVILRDDGIEPASDPLAAMRLLYARTKAPELVPAGLALRALSEGKASREEVLVALGCARERSRWAAWIESVEMALRVRERAAYCAG